MSDRKTAVGDAHEYWRAALEGRFGAVLEREAQPGKYRLKRGSEWAPVCIAIAEDGVRWVWVGRDVSDDPDTVARTWLACAKHPVSDDDYFHHLETGHWLTDPPAGVAPAEPQPDATAPPLAKGSVPGDNSGDPGSFEAMRANLMGDIAEARAYYARNPIKTKIDADKCENWRKRINDAADALEVMRRAEKRPHDDAIAEIQARYKPIFEAVSECAGKRGLLDNLGQAWIDAENTRRRREAEERARAEHEARVAAAEAERKRLQEEREAKLRDDPVAALTEPEPALPTVPAAAAPAVFAPAMIGTTGNRRGAQSAPHTATIDDPKALALHLIAQKHPDLMECLQRIANAAARSKARTALPGCTMSWERGGKAA
jgi:hypothetical protein